MNFLSFAYFLFLPAAALVYRLLPKDFRRYWLLLMNLVFYLSANPLYAVTLALSILTTYRAGILAGACADDPKRKRRIYSLTLVVNIGVIVICKYLNFLLETGAWLSGREFTPLQILAPAGIMFYILEACGYVIDCGRRKVTPERDLVAYAVFVSFFPTILSGPIERAGNMLTQIKRADDPVRDDVFQGILILLWGYFLKLCLADRIALYVNEIYCSPEMYSGFRVMLAVLLYMTQLYCDFYGYSSIAQGSARIMGFRIMENFISPLLSESVSEFWRRWHISLSTWFRDYLYIPLGGNRKGPVRKYINLMIVFAVSGLWHGASITFLVWGLVHGLMMVVGEILTPMRRKVNAALGFNTASFTHRLMKTAVTYFAVSLAFVFFRADDLHHAWRILTHMWEFQPWILLEENIFEAAFDLNNTKFMILCLVLLVLTDALRKKGFRIRRRIAVQNLPVRWAVFIIAAIVISICGVWGPGYNAASFIYQRF